MNYIPSKPKVIGSASKIQYPQIMKVPATPGLNVSAPAIVFLSLTINDGVEKLGTD